jgi:mono/diheme cytochrome c family protein
VNEHQRGLFVTGRQSPHRAIARTSCLSFLVLLAGCVTHDPLAGYEALTPTTVMEAPRPAAAGGTATADQVAHGRYLVELLGCGSCHTDGALLGEPRSDRQLAGSDIGIAYTDPMDEIEPGVAFPRNLTPDPATGLGTRSDDQIAQAIRGGANRHGVERLVVMPWGAYSILTDADVYAIVAYLRSIPAVSHEVPDSVPPGERASGPYIFFGTYRSL